MTHRIRSLPLFPLCLAALAAACSAEIITADITSSGTNGTGGTGGTGGAQHAGPPAAGPATPPDGTGSVTFAISKLYLGDTDRDGTPDVADGWKQFGFDLDGKLSTKLSTDLCKPRDNALPGNVYPDGNAGIDNAFGRSILPILLAISANFPAKQNEMFASGKATYLFDLEKLGAAAAYSPILARYYPGADLGHPPSYDGNDLWPVDAAGLTDAADLGSAKAVLPQSYVIGDTWVGHVQGTLRIQLDDGAFPLPIDIEHAIITMDLGAMHTGATNGTIAGVIRADVLVATFKEIASAFDPTLCFSPTIDGITSQLTQAADIMQDGSQDATAPCDGISIGLGFDAQVVKLGAITPSAKPPPNPCQ